MQKKLPTTCKGCMTVTFYLLICYSLSRSMQLLHADLEDNSIIPYSSQTVTRLIHFNILKDAAYKHLTGSRRNVTTEKSHHARQHHLLSIQLFNAHRFRHNISTLDKSIHFRLVQIEVHTIEEQIDANRGTTAKRDPTPMVVLGIQQDVRAHDAHAHLDDGENDCSSSPFATPTQH